MTSSLPRRCRRRLILAACALAIALPVALPVVFKSLPASADNLPHGELPHGDLLLRDAWARATPGGARTGAAYLRIENHGDTPDTLVGAAADIAERVEIHSMTMENDTMVMGPAGEIAIPAHGAIELKPHGLHIMLMGLKQPLAEGDSFPVTLDFAKAGSVQIEIDIHGIGSSGHSDNHSDGHSDDHSDEEHGSGDGEHSH